MSMDGKTPDLLPLSAAKKIRDAVPLVCGWTLLNTFSTAVGYIAVDYIHVSCSQVTTYPCTALRCLTFRPILHSAVHRADGRGGSQGKRPLDRDAVLRLVTGGRGGAGTAATRPPSLARCAVAYLALAVTVLDHCMIYFTAGFCFFVVGDLLSFRALLGGDGWGMKITACADGLIYADGLRRHRCTYADGQGQAVGVEKPSAYMWPSGPLEICLRGLSA
ncbi:hypothetical protein VPH35_060944 [Triticum aestivum]